MKKLLILLLTLLMVFELSACNKNVPVAQTGDYYGDNDVRNQEKEDYQEKGTEEEEKNETEIMLENEFEDIDNKEPSGLIFLKHSYDKTIERFELVQMNPNTGEYSVFTTFSYRHNHNGNPVSSFSECSNIYNKYTFSPDYSKLAGTYYCYEKNANHAGWIDSDGGFFDLNEALGLVAKSDFDIQEDYRGVGFMSDGQFVYANRNGSGWTSDWSYYSLDPDDLTKITEYEENPLDIRFKEYLITDYLDNNRVIVNKNNKNSVILNLITNEETEYIPGKTRQNKNGVVSPDKKQIAFMSANGDINIYITGVNGGEPVKVNTDIEIEHESMQYRNGDAFDDGAPMTFLIDWKATPGVDTFVYEDFNRDEVIEENSESVCAYIQVAGQWRISNEARGYKDLTTICGDVSSGTFEIGDCVKLTLDNGEKAEAIIKEIDMEGETKAECHEGDFAAITFDSTIECLITEVYK